MAVTPAPTPRQTIAYSDRPMAYMRQGGIYASQDFAQFLQRLSTHATSTATTVSQITDTINLSSDAVESVNAEIAALQAQLTSLQNQLNALSGRVSGLSYGTIYADDALPGIIGEEISSLVTAAVTLTSNAAADVTSIALSAGDWQVVGEVWFTAPVTAMNAAIDLTLATLPTAPAFGSARTSVGAASTSPSVVPVGPTRINVSTAVTAHLVALATFSGSCTAMGVIAARRMR